MKPIVGIAYNNPAAAGGMFSEASNDVMIQVAAVEAALSELGYATHRLLFTRDLVLFVAAVKESGVSMIVNLCETVDDIGSFAGHPAAVFELLGIPFTGSSSMAIMSTTDKLLGKRLLRSVGLRTPHCVVYDGEQEFHGESLRYPVIVKPRYEDASIGIDQTSVCMNERAVRALLPGRCRDFGTLIVEEYIEGREFNISLLGYPVPQVFPPAEIDFSGLPESLHRIVGYEAKWEPDSVEFRCTNRVFPKLSERLRVGLETVALESYRLFMLRDYGRVDVRIDDQERIYILEVNANPCLSPDAGFPAAVMKAGMRYRDMVGILVAGMCRRGNLP